MGVRMAAPSTSTTLAIDILKQAREAILARNYGLARMLLNTLPRDPRAQKWLAKLDEIAPEAEGDTVDYRPTFSSLIPGDSQSTRTVAAAVPVVPKFEAEPPPGAMPRAAVIAYSAAGAAMLLTLIGLLVSAAAFGLTSGLVVAAVVGGLVTGWLLITAVTFQYLNAILVQQKRSNDLLTRIEQHLR